MNLLYLKALLRLRGSLPARQQLEMPRPRVYDAPDGSESASAEQALDLPQTSGEMSGMASGRQSRTDHWHRRSSLRKLPLLLCAAQPSLC